MFSIQSNIMYCRQTAVQPNLVLMSIYIDAAEYFWEQAEGI